MQTCLPAMCEPAPRTSKLPLPAVLSPSRQQLQVLDNLLLLQQASRSVLLALPSLAAHYEIWQPDHSTSKARVQELQNLMALLTPGSPEQCKAVHLRPQGDVHHSQSAV